MDLLECLLSHRSIRAYKPDPVSDETLDQVLRAATRASTSGNMQTYSIIVTRDASRRARLWEIHFRQEMIKQAPVLLTFCADWNRMNRWCRACGADPGYDNLLSFLVGAADAFVAAQNAAVAAEGLGLGICYMGTTLGSPRELIEFFGLPPGVFPVTTLVVGHPDEDPEPRSRLPLESIVHRERYEDYDAGRIEAAYRDRDEEGWKRYQSFPQLRDLIRESGVENLAQVYTDVKYPREGNRRISRALMDALARQEFLEHGEDDAAG